MLPDLIELVIVTPERQLLKQTVAEVNIPGANGRLGILPGHAPLITELGVGELNYRGKNSSVAEHLAVISGFAEVLADQVSILAETAERAEEIDVARAEEAKKRAEERLAEAAKNPDIDWDRASAALQRAMVRLHVAEFGRKRHAASFQNPQ
jgi:F-type H+-transporting ATPase subunit epsilon